MGITPRLFSTGSSSYRSHSPGSGPKPIRAHSPGSSARPVEPVRRSHSPGSAPQSIRSHSSSYSSPEASVTQGLSPMALEPGNPDPMRWTLLRGQKVGRGFVAEIHYPDCTNYEGKKILVFKAAGMDAIVQKNKGMLDPHFTDDCKMVAPVARFEPTERGWELALLIAANL